MGIFITFEGGEGSGKSTQIQLLYEVLASRDFNVIRTREPGGTPVADSIREILLDGKNSKLCALAELFLYEASRAQHVEELIKPTLKNKKTIVLCDRFTDATLAYQAGARKLGSELVKQLNDIASSSLNPDITFYLDIDPNIGLKRSIKRLADEQSNEDRFEKESIAFHKRVRQSYLKIAKSQPNRIKVINAEQNINKIQNEILEHIECFLNKL